MDVTVSYGMRLAEASIKLIRGNHLIARSPFRCLVLLNLRSGLRLTPGSMASGSSCVRRGVMQDAMVCPAVCGPHSSSRTHINSVEDAVREQCIRVGKIPR